MAPRKASVLLVEDERLIADDLRATLTELGYDVYAVAASSDQAIAHAAERAPDVVLMDIKIDGARDGVETADILRKRYNAPIVFLSAYADEATLARAKATEPYAYLVKPVTAATMQTAIEIALYRHGMETRLRERERWFATTLRSIGDAVIAIDRTGRIEFMNHAAEELTGVVSADAVGRAADELVQQPWQRAMELETTVSRAEALMDSGRGARVVADTAAPVIDNGHLLGAVMVIRDITESKVARRHDELAEQHVSVGAMASRLAHQVNNPLAVIVMQSEQIRGELQRCRELFERSDATAAARVNDAIVAQDALDKAVREISRTMFDARAFTQVPNAPGSADVRRAVEWAVKTATPELRDRARVATKLERVQHVALDEPRLGQILLSLLDNAAHAFAPGNADTNLVEVSVRAEDDGNIAIEVRDTGRGMPAELIRRVFAPSFTERQGAVGVSLGLSLARAIARDAGGDVSIESTIGSGTTVRVVLPPVGHERVRGGRDDELRGRVLVIDDDDSYLRGVRRALRGHDVTCCTSVGDALEELERERFDIILTEMRMPDMSGIEFYEKLARDRPDDARRVVFVAALPTTDKYGDFLAAVPNHCVDKPLPPAALRALIREFVARRDTPAL